MLTRLAYHVKLFIFITGLCGLHLPAGGFFSELNEAAVFLAAFKQFFMCTAVDPSPVKHHDLIGISYRLEPVRDHDHCLVFRQGVESGNQFMLTVPGINMEKPGKLFAFPVQ